MNPLSPPPETLEAIARLFRVSPGALSVRPVSDGLINFSFRVSVAGSADIFLQAINRQVFSSPEDLQHNYDLIYRHIRQTSDNVKIPDPVNFSDGKSLFYDKEKRPWRLFKWITSSRTIEKVSTIEQAAAVAQVFGRFSLSLTNGFDPSTLRETIPHFHDLSLRYTQFLQAVNKAIPARKTGSSELINELLERKHYVEFFDSLALQKNDFPLRVMHHDAKISNILFNVENEEPWGPIDLDTVMPGYFFSDLGDMIRSITPTVDENCRDIKAITLREDYYHCIVETYTETMSGSWTKAEYAAIPMAGPLMVYMQALRFLSDHLQGDTYYRVSLPGQNYERALNQFTLLQQLEKYLNISRGSRN